MEICINKDFEKALVPLSTVEFEKLRENIIATQGIDPAVSKILLWQPDPKVKKAYIIEGHNRWKICQEEGFELSDDCFDYSEPFESEEDVIRWIENNQLGRRNISKYARFEIIYRRDGEKLEAEGKKRMSDGGKGLPNHNKKKFRMDEELAPYVGTSPRTVKNFLRIYKHYLSLVENDEVTDEIEEIMVGLRTGDMTTNEAIKKLFVSKKLEKEDCSYFDYILVSLRDQLRKYNLTIDNNWKVFPII